jgi:uncharacterized protein DUF4339
MSEPAIWYYEWQGRQAGPVAHASLLDLVRTGQLRPESRVWRSGMPGWEPLRNVPEVAAALPAPAPLPGPPPTFAPPAGPTAVTPAPGAPAPAPAPPSAADPTGFAPISWGVFVALTIVTFGVYAVVRYYAAARAYEALAGRASRFATYFWLYVGLGVAGLALGGAVGGSFGAMSGVASLVFGVLSLLEAIALREDAIRRQGISAHLTADSTHRALGIAAAATTWLGIGVIIAVVEGVLFFQDHDAIARALAGRRALTATAPVPSPAPPPAAGTAAPAAADEARAAPRPGERSAADAPAGRTCARCGNALALPARFCDRCGAPAPGYVS